MDDTNPLDALDEQRPQSALTTTPAQSNPLDSLDDTNPLDALDSAPASADTAERMRGTLKRVDETLPEVTVSHRSGPESSWSDVASAVMPAIRAKLETKMAGAQEAYGSSVEQAAKKRLWQSMILPQAVREAKDQNISLTDHPDVVDIAQHLGIRPDQFTRDWPKYANMTPEQLQQVQADARERLQSGQSAAETGAQRRQTAAKVSEAYAPNIPQYGLKSLAFSTATMIPDLLAGTAATVATGGIGGAALMATSIAPEEYANARNRGLNDRDASTYAMLSTVASSVPEIPVLKVIENAPIAKRIIGGVVGDKLAGTAAGKMAGTAVTQGVTQSLVQALQTGIDDKMFDEDTSLSDALKKIAFAGVSGAVAGVPMGAMHVATSHEHTPATPGQDRVEPIIGPDLGTIAANTARSEPTLDTAQAVESSDQPSSATQAAAGESQNQLGTTELAGQDLHDALKAVQDKTVNPAQLESLESMNLATRNDVNVPRLLPAGRRQLTESLRAIAQGGTEVSDRVVPSEAPRIQTDQELRAGLEAMKGETGWAEEGGHLLRSASTGEVSGRTSWIPNSEWWPDRPKGMSEPAIHQAVDKALAGQPLKPAEQRMVDFMTQVHDERTAMTSTHQQLEQAVPEIHEQPHEAVDLTLLASRAGDHDANATSKVIDSWADDKPETLTRVQGELERIIGRGQQEQTRPEGAGGLEPAQTQRSPQAEDLFGEHPQEAQRRAEFTQQLEQARADTHPEPTDGQKEAGNYRKGRLDFAGMEVALENPKGSTRSGVDVQGHPWESTLKHDYGYLVGSRASDKEGVDVFLTGKPDTGKMFVINQVHPETGKYDEAKVVAGARTAAEAESTYKANYTKGWKGLGSMAEMSTERFKQWLQSGQTHKPVRTNVERREDVVQRKKVAEMSSEEAKRELLTHELTDIPNRRAYVESEKLPTQVSIDVDSLKAVNDLGGHHAGDELLKAVAQVLHEETEHAYHLSGDEFAVQSLHPREAEAVMQRATDRLKDAEIIVTMPDGRVLSLKGLGVSYGVGEDLGKADTALQAHKKQREAEGTRAPRGEAPRGLTFRSGEAGREDHRSTATAKEEVEPKARRTTILGGLPRAHVERIVHQTIREAHLVTGFPHVEVHEDTSTLPERINRLIEQQGAQSLTGAVYDPTTDRIHIIASNNGSEREVRENLWHEAVGHHGLRMAMEPTQYNAVMDGIYKDMPERVQYAAERNGLDVGDVGERRAAAEEVIAYAAGQKLSGQRIDTPIIPWLTRIVRAVKGFFSRMVGKPFYDDRAILGLIKQAHKALETGAAGTVPGESVRSTRAPTFYSPVERAVEGSKQGKASADQWFATLKKTAGVKPDELEWLDLENWLKGHKGLISKEELGEYVRANRLDLEETVQGGDEQTDLQKQQTRLAEQLRAEGHHVVFDDDGHLEYITVGPDVPEHGEGGDYYLHDPIDREALPESVADRVFALDELSNRVAAERSIDTPGYRDTTQYSDYTLPGGENYREMLLRLPDSPTEERQASGGDADLENFRLGGRQPIRPPYRSSHWKESNILAHVRFNERTDADGKKVLFLEELQSDWHQIGRKTGYRGSVDNEALHGEKEQAFQNHRQAVSAVTELMSHHRPGQPLTPEIEDARARMGETDRAYRQAESDWSKAESLPPDAPFKTSWPMLIMKRMVRWAAENGFERIAWTTGEQQAERYALEKHIDELHYWKNQDGTYRIQGGKDDRVVISHDKVPAAELPEYVGQELAEKITSGAGTRDDAWRDAATVLEGLDLRIGGEGMRGFYDQILPRETDKFIKKFDSKVQDSTVKGMADDPMSTGIPTNFASHGFDITDEMRQAALGQGFPMFARRQQQLALQQPGPTGVYDRIKRAVDWLTENPFSRDVRKLFHPAGLSPDARRTAQIASAALGKLAHETFETQHALEQFSRQIDKLPVQDQLDMIDRIEHGVPQEHPEFQPVADEMRKLLDTWRDKVRGLGSGYLDKFIENYFPHYWDRGDEAQRMVASIQGRRTLRGPATFLKMRTIPTIKEGMEAGLRPLTVNPLIMTLLKTREMQRFVTGVTLLRRLKEDGLAEFVPASKRVPEGWREIDDPSARVSSWSEEEGGWIDRGRYAMPEHAARIINNHLSASMLKDFGPATVLRTGANMLNALQLSFSAFHLGFTTLDAIISKTALGVERLAHGEPLKAAQAFGEAATGPGAAVMNVRRGYQLMKAYANPAGATPQMLKLVAALEKGGGRVQMDRYYLAAQGGSPFHGVGAQSLAKDIHQALTAPTEKLQNLARALGAFPQEYSTALLHSMQQLVHTTHPLAVPFEVAGRITRASTSWIMEHVVPMQKLGVFSDLAQDHIARNPNQDPNEQAVALQKAWAAVDDRLGEMVYDNLFLNRTFKDILHFGIRAVGWNWGTWRSIGGAPIDVMKMADKLISSGKVTADDLGHKIPYVMAMGMTTALYGAIYQYLSTGEGPQELKDYFFPRTGGTTNYGTPQRVSLPSYAKDVYEYSQRPGTTVLNKLNPIFNVIGEMWNNEDFFGNPITDPDASALQATGQRLSFLAHEAAPFSSQGRQQIAGSDQPGTGGTVRQVLPYFGITPAPGYVTSPDQMERRERYEREQKYTKDLKYKMTKAYEAKDKATGDEYRDRYIRAIQHMKQTEVDVKQDRAKAAVSRRKAATTLRQQGRPATADLVASLPLEPDAPARDYFQHIRSEG